MSPLSILSTISQDSQQNTYWLKGNSNFNQAFLDEFMDAYQIQLPPEYCSFILATGKIMLKGKGQQISFFNEDELHSIPDHPFSEGMEGAFVFGNDQGGHLFFYDTQNQSGLGVNSVFLVYPGSPFWHTSRYLGANLTEVFQKIIAGDSFVDYPFLKR